MEDVKVTKVGDALIVSSPEIDKLVASGVVNPVAMRLESFYKAIERNLACGTYIVHLFLRQDYEEKYEEINEIMNVDIDGNVIWENDWCEGETDVWVVGMIDYNDVTTWCLSEYLKK